MLRPRRGRDESDDAREEQGDPELARRVLAHTGTPEERLEQLLERHRQDLDEQAGRVEEAMADLERREQLLTDMRASVERLLRLGATDLDAREQELQGLGRELAERDARLREAEEELSRRRGELGAVELRREALEQRERALAAREVELAVESDQPEAGPAEESAQDVEPGEEAAAEPDEPAATARTEPDDTGPEDAEPAEAEAPPTSLLFLPGPGYRLVAIEGVELDAGSEYEHAGEPYVVARVGPSPLPGDSRRCAYLERGASSPSASSGSS